MIFNLFLSSDLKGQLSKLQLNQCFPQSGCSQVSSHCFLYLATTDPLDSEKKYSLIYHPSSFHFLWLVNIIITEMIITTTVTTPTILCNNHSPFTRYYSKVLTWNDLVSPQNNLTGILRLRELKQFA